MSDITVGSVWLNKKDTRKPRVASRLVVIHNKAKSSFGETWTASYFKGSFLEKFSTITSEKLLSDYLKTESKCIDEYLGDLIKGRKDDSAKRRYSLLPKGTVNSVVDVLEFGSKKYADNNWQKVPNAKTRYYDAALRHIDAWFGGEIKDIETGLPHLAHAICCLMFLMWFDSE